ncbi:MAG: hypothetical protein HPZ91_11175 [Lentisphaeria bacterium]|nr:hypothetical protein [Lentisphaeria bacterium]
MKKLTAILFLAAGFAGFAAERPGVTGSPYGACAHLNRWEYPEMRQELRMMKEAGIGLDRTDLDWKQVEPEKGRWDFSKWDSILDAAERNNITLLPILAGMQPRRSSPLADHMDEWKTYLSTVVNRYKNRIGYWEVVNEPDLGEFSGNHAGYATFLKESYDCIKAADPGAIVTNGGLANMEKAGEFLKLAPPDSFDVLNIHRYCWQDYPEGELRSLLRGIRADMKRYGHDKKPVWLTETGYSTAPAPELAGVLAYALRMLKLDDPSLPVVLIDDPDYLYSTECVNLDLKSLFREKRSFRRIPLSGLAKLDPRNSPLLLLPMNEGYPSAFHEPLVAYLEKGGTVIFPGGGIPFYFDRIRHPDGSIENRGASDRILRELHISWDAWWKNKNAPRSTRLLEAVPGAGELRFPKSANRYLGRENLEPGDELIPIVNAWSKDRSWSAPVAGIYRFNSSLKGNLIAFTWQDCSHRTSPEWQAMLLPRTFLLAFSEGVEKVFTYSFRSMEQYFPDGREGHFGLLRHDLTPKGAYTAYATLTRMRPAGSQDLGLSAKNGVYIANWKKPDGTPVSAVWTVSRPETVRLKAAGKLKSACDHLGNPLSVDASPGSVRVPAGPGVIYLEGLRLR